MDNSPAKPPPAPKAKLADLPAVEDSSDPSIVNENTDIENLTPAQLYDLNLVLFNESVPDRPLIDDIAHISELRREYENGSPSFVQQIDWLEAHSFHYIRRARGDGDCFYRSTAFAFVERLLYAPDRDLAVAQALAVLDSTKSMLDSVGFQKLVYEDFHDVLAYLIQAISVPLAGQERTTPASLLQAFQLPETSNSIVTYLRLVTSAQIRLADELQAVLLNPETGDYMDPQRFCEHFVEATGKEADHVQMTALCRALKLSIDVAYLDGKRSGGVDFVPIRPLEGDSKPIVLLYRPGHYDILVTGNGQQ